MTRLLTLLPLLVATALASCANYRSLAVDTFSWWGVPTKHGDRLFGGKYVFSAGYAPLMSLDVDLAFDSALEQANSGTPLDPGFVSATHYEPGEARTHRSANFGGEIRVLGPETDPFGDWVLQYADGARAEGARVYVVSLVDSGASLVVYGTRGWPTEVVEIGRVDLPATNEEGSP